ncbi:cytochrome C [Deinococcus cavernae]|uniref:Cytochrome C n=1 Tax=Deinococcus cavernae TaxID=2320857 RepID=A0A418UZX8_9DEIO|nr:heme-binding domain-containing protein [Deinococcus cavernae]RJF69012.1 cytochrome C [Deinococcus cavernae]
MHLTRQSHWSPARLLGLLLGLFIVLQLVPYGRAHANPPAAVEPQWDSPSTRALFDRACADCHSHRTKWPWYSNVAPVSWLVQNHVDEGRHKFNINTPGFGRDADEAASQVRKGAMPEKTYLPMHPEARLTDTERDQLIRGLQATFGGESEAGNGESGDNDGD